LQYEIIKTYEVKEMTCGEAVEILSKTGDIYCLHEFVDPNFPDDVANFKDSWGWVQARSPQKKILLIVDEVSSIGRSL
jgi:hypothetical protein